MLTGIIIVAVISLLGVFSHRNSRLENKIYKHVPLTDWMTVFFIPVGLYMGWFSIMRTVVERPFIRILPLDDFDILAITILFMIYGFVGNSMHFTGKILWRYLPPLRHSMAWRVNEMFHGRLGHYLVYLNMMFIILLLAVLEINHPLPQHLAGGNEGLVILVGILSGFALSKAVFYTNQWFGGYNKPLFLVGIMIIIFQYMLLGIYGLHLDEYPLSMFVLSGGTGFCGSQVIRQAMIFAKLPTRRRLRFIAHLFSAATPS